MPDDGSPQWSSVVRGLSCDIGHRSSQRLHREDEFDRQAVDEAGRVRVAALALQIGELCPAEKDTQPRRRVGRPALGQAGQHFDRPTEHAQGVGGSARLPEMQLTVMTTPSLRWRICGRTAWVQ